MTHNDPTARRALRSSDSDVLGAALARLREKDAMLFVLHYCFEVPLAALLRIVMTTVAGEFRGYDWAAHIRDKLDSSHLEITRFLQAENVTWDDLDWHTSPAVRSIGERCGVNTLLPCLGCGQQKIPLIGLAVLRHHTDRAPAVTSKRPQ
ncbi:hypothetical protein KCV87_15825 [Actinosynnema pretiosum subsp. pretiosum]|uniref:Uncharacterized protein n=1 Tax=Actinosynnema pretiosum subsp. pretiosum TaxID=103721 RepID=A0AA45LDQ5_9PSEU|nr:hypothetical protein KCV87_15825 [Actinosynnema pretiosum subsp. pretiosum]